MQSKLMIKNSITALAAIYTLTAFTSCGSKDSSSLAPVSEKSEITIPSDSHTDGLYVDQIGQLAGSSMCADYSWQGRGRAPAGYINGVALSFARSLCRVNKSSALAKIMSAANSNNDYIDALSYYQNKFSVVPIQINEPGDESLRALYVLGMGLGMRESSGRYCEGWDVAAGSNRPSSAGEAGLFQTSLDSMSASIELSKLYTEYHTAPSERCFLNVFKEGVSCNSNSILGTGPGADFQKFNKVCPAFATEYAMTMLRIARTHYGPINRIEAEVVPACDQMLKEVQYLMTSDIEKACQDIN